MAVEGVEKLMRQFNQLGTMEPVVCKAVKKQVQEMTRIMLNLEKIPKPDDAADALAMAICHCHSAGSLIGRLSR